MIDRIRIISMFKINDRKIFIVDHAWLKLFCDHTCDLFAVAKLLVGIRYSLTYTHVLDLERQNRQLRADTNSPSISPVSPRAFFSVQFYTKVQF